MAQLRNQAQSQNLFNWDAFHEFEIQVRIPLSVPVVWCGNLSAMYLKRQQ